MSAAKTKNRIFALMLAALLAALWLTPAAFADTGPKPSVTVTVEGAEGRLCYGTLLSKASSTGPASAWDGNPDHANYPEGERELWQTFQDYEDEDGYYFLQWYWLLEDGEFSWGYYPPNDFKILIYFPDTGEFAVTEALERYAFDSYYTVNLEDGASAEYDEARSGNGRYEAYRSYQYRQELTGLAARILITITIEMAVALAFGFWHPRQILVLAAANTATQVALNLLLNLINYRSGWRAFVFYYVVFEIIVVIIEAALYCTLLRRVSEKPRPRWFYILYAVLANAVSYWVGMLLANKFPVIF